jgi:hypothetical protein
MRILLALGPSNQVGEIVAIKDAVETAPLNAPLKTLWGGYCISLSGSIHTARVHFVPFLYGSLSVSHTQL